MKITLSILLLLFLQGCTIAYYETKDNLKNSTKTVSKPTCDIIYSIKITTKQYHSIDINKERLKYIASTNKIFKDYNCSAKYEKDTANTNFFINITIAPYGGAMAQEYLTGLSFGLIPSWGTRPNRYRYEFINKIDSTQHTYSIDDVSYNHLVLFPFVWVNIFTYNELRIFEDSLKNFIENS